MDERKQFTFYLSWFQSLSKIRNKSERLRVYDAICQLALLNQDTELFGTAGAVFDSIRPVVLQGIERSQSGRKGAEAKWKQTDGKPMASQAFARQEQVQGKGKGKGKYKERNIKERKIASLSPTPTLEDVENYCSEKDYKHVSPDRFWSHYQSRGWKLFGAPIEDWTALVDRWESEDAQKAKEEKPADPRRPIAPEQKATSGDIERMRRMIDEMNGEVKDA